MKLRTIKYLSLIPLSTIILSGCGLMRENCRDLAYKAGMQSSLKGSWPRTKRGFYANNVICNIIGSNLSYHTYMQHWKDGRAKYCSPQSATSLGEHNDFNISICNDTPTRWDIFKQAYKQGLKTYWQQQGKSDSTQGLNTRTHLSDQQKKYSSYDIFFNPRPDYKTGYLQGIKTFCTYQSGFSYGSVGSINRQICQQYAPTQNANFLNGYREGLETNYCIAPVVFKQGLGGHTFPNTCKRFHNRKTVLMNAWTKGNNTWTHIQQAQNQLHAVKKVATSIRNQLNDEQNIRDDYNNHIQSKHRHISKLLAQKKPPLQQINKTKSQIAKIKKEKIPTLNKINELQRQLRDLLYQERTLTFTIHQLKLTHA
jgi:hypothetical protein